MRGLLSPGSRDADPPHDRSQPAAVIVGLDSLTGLQSARVFAQRGVPVLALAKDAGHYCCRTRACGKPVVTNIEGPELIEALIDLGRRLTQPAFLLPCTDLSVLQISQHRERLAPWFRFRLPAHETLNRLLDKAAFIEFANQHQLPIPPSAVLRNTSDAKSAADSLTFPCVLKPSVKTTAWMTRVGDKGYVAENGRDLIQRFDAWRQVADELVVQQWIGGSLTDQFTCNCYLGEGAEPLVTFVTRKLRQWPHKTGIACLSEECRDEETERRTIELFRMADYRGLGYLEIKRDPRDDRSYIIEPNVGRPTGRAISAEAGGVELLMTAYCDALELPLPSNRSQQFTPIKWVHRRRELQSALQLWRSGKLSLADWRKSRSGPKIDALFQWNDWGPFLGDLLHAAGKLRTKNRTEHSATRAEQLRDLENNATTTNKTATRPAETSVGAAP